MRFLEKLVDITGTQQSAQGIVLIEHGVTGTAKYINSGLWNHGELEKGKLDYRELFGKVDQPINFFRQGPRINLDVLNMPANCLDQGPHCHPGGEFAYIKSGEYWDADMNGRPIRIYDEGSIVCYAQGSSHRPLSEVGAEIFYLQFDGIVFGKDALDLAKKMKKIGTQEEALEFALLWMIPDKQERQKVLDELVR